MPGNAGAEVAEDAAKTKTLPGDPPVERVPVDGAEAGRPGGEAELPRAEEPLAEVKPAAEPAIEPPPRTSAPDEITPLNEPARAPTGDHPADQPAPEVGDPLSPRPEYYSSPKGGTFDDWAQQNRDTVDFYQAHPEAREKPNLPWDHPDNLPDGTPLTSEQLKNFEGMPLVNQLGTQAVADKYGVDLVLRGTNPESLAHLEAGAVPKPMSLKPKTVKDIDLKISGGTLTSADQGLVAHFEPQLNGKTLRSPDPATRLTATDPEFQALSDKEQARFFARDLDYVVQQGHIDDLVSKGLISVDENGILRNTGLSKLPQFEGQPFAGDHDLYSITKDGQPIGNDAAGNQLRLDIQRDLENFGNGGHRDHLHWDYKAFELEPNPDYAGATQENRRMHDMFYEIINKHVPVPLGGNGEALIQFSPKSPPSVRYASSQDVFIARPADGIVPGH